MHNQRRLISVLLTMVMVALIFWGSNGELSVKGQGDSEEEAGWIGKKETIYVWYTDPDLESYLNSAAVSFSEAEGVRVIPILKSASTLLQDAYRRHYRLS